jgi:hypothetical protein
MTSIECERNRRFLQLQDLQSLYQHQAQEFLAKKYTVEKEMDAMCAEKRAQQEVELKQRAKKKTTPTKRKAPATAKKPAKKRKKSQTPSKKASCKAEKQPTLR